MRSPPDHESWLVIALAALGITAAVFLIAKIKTPLERTQAGHMIWIFVGAFAAVAIAVGGYDMMISGYGDGDIF